LLTLRTGASLSGKIRIPSGRCIRRRILGAAAVFVVVGLRPALAIGGICSTRCRPGHIGVVGLLTILAWLRIIPKSARRALASAVAAEQHNEDQYDRHYHDDSGQSDRQSAAYAPDTGENTPQTVSNVPHVHSIPSKAPKPSAWANLKSELDMSQTHYIT
jgi:hypothetical protein